jgi:hypothetical protein
MITKMKTKEDILLALREVFGQLKSAMQAADDNAFKKSTNGKWSIAQNIDHLSISNSITALSLDMPKPVLIQLFKTNNRPNWNYDEVVWKYQRSLSEGAKATLPFQPKLSLVPVRFIVENYWNLSSAHLLKSVEKWKEQDLDTYLIPHPIIGKITVRELLFFTVYHLNHHLKTIQALSA